MKISNFIKKSPVIPILLGAEAVSRRLNEHFGKFDLSTMEALVLVGIFFEEKDVRPSELAKALKVSRARLSQALSSLLRREYLNRKIESKDARFINIQITSSGRQLALKLIKVFDKESMLIETKLGVKKAESTAENLLSCIEI